jgi:hypothetical protein
MMAKDEALKMAIETIETWSDGGGKECELALNACKKALEQPAQQPVAWMHRHAGEITEFNDFQSCEYCEPLYTHPHQWQGLTDDEIGDIYCNTPAQPISNGDVDLMFDFARAIEQALKDKNT